MSASCGSDGGDGSEVPDPGQSIGSRRFDISTLVAVEAKRTRRSWLFSLYGGVAIGLLILGAAIYRVFVFHSTENLGISAVLAAVGVMIIVAAAYYYRAAQRPRQSYVEVTDSYVEFCVPRRLPLVRLTWSDPRFAISIIDDRQIGTSSNNRSLPRGIYAGPPGRPGAPIPPEAYTLLLRITENHGLTAKHVTIPNPGFLGGGSLDRVTIQRAR